MRGLLLPLVLLALLVLLARGSDVYDLQLGGSRNMSSLADQTQYFSFTKTTPVLEGVETIIMRVTREEVFHDQADTVRLCFGAESPPQDCSDSSENFELWIAYDLLQVNTVYYVGVYSTASIPYIIRACISTCPQLCPNDCNGKFVARTQNADTSKRAARCKQQKTQTAVHASTPSVGATRRKQRRGAARIALTKRRSSCPCAQGTLLCSSFMPLSLFVALVLFGTQNNQTKTRDVLVRCDTGCAPAKDVGVSVRLGQHRPYDATQQEEEKVGPPSREEAATTNEKNKACSLMHANRTALNATIMD